MKIYNVITDWTNHDDRGCDVQSYANFETAFKALQDFITEDEDYGIVNAMHELYAPDDVTFTECCAYSEVVCDKTAYTKDGKLYINFRLEMEELQ